MSLVHSLDRQAIYNNSRIDLTASAKANLRSAKDHLLLSGGLMTNSDRISTFSTGLFAMGLGAPVQGFGLIAKTLLFTAADLITAPLFAIKDCGDAAAYASVQGARTLGVF